VQVNLAELNARIRGYHHGLAEIEAALITGQRSAAHLAAVVEDLERLAGQYQFLRLYYDSLTSVERRRVPRPRTLAEVVALAKGQLAASTGEDFLQAFDARSGESPTLADRLDALSNVEKDAGAPAGSAGSPP
jgi:hypothetical protein